MPDSWMDYWRNIGPDMRPTKFRPAVHQVDPREMDEALNQATQMGFIVADIALNPVLGTLNTIFPSQGIRPVDPRSIPRYPGMTEKEAAQIADPENWLLGQARWRSMGITPGQLREINRPTSIMHGNINRRNTVYHATSPLNVESILGARAIRPNTDVHNAGVSVTRVPHYSPNAGANVVFELDQSQLPKARPIAEQGYEKTRPDYGISEALGVPNSAFEYENRTYNQSIPTTAIKRGILNQEGMFPYLKEQYTDEMKNIFSQYGVPLEIVPDKRQMQTIRARNRK